MCHWKPVELLERLPAGVPTHPLVFWRMAAHPCSWGSAAVRSETLLRWEKFVLEVDKHQQHLGSCVKLMIERWHQNWTFGRISL